MSEIDPIRRLRENLPAARPAARDAARAALMERVEAPGHAPAERRLFGRRALTLAGAVAVTAAAILIAIGSGGGPAVEPESATAADLRHLAEISPRLLIVGPWQIVRTEASASEGQTEFSQTQFFHSPADGSRTVPTRSAEIRWHSGSVQEQGRQLSEEGFVRAGTAPIVIHRPYLDFTQRLDLVFDQGTAQVYVSRHRGQRVFQAIGLWQEHGRAFELRTSIPDFQLLERLLERLSKVGSDEWLVALQPGGGEWLGAVKSGVVREEVTRIGETRDGRPVLRRKAILKPRRPGKAPDYRRPLTIVYREGDKVRVVVQKPPTEYANTQKESR